MSDLDKKVAKMKQKTEEAARAFNLPETEPVIQDYSCSFFTRPGRMYITPNYCCWLPGIGADGVQIPFRKIKTIKKDKSAFVFDNAITIELEDNQPQFFHGLVHRDETFNLLFYLWKNPPSYVELEDDDFWNSKSNTTTNTNPFEQNFNNNSTQVQVTAKVDTQSTKNAIRLAHQARDMGTATLSELTVQAEQMDRIEHNVETIHSNMDKANRLLRGIESVGGTMANAFTKDAPGHGPMEFKDRSLEVKKKEKPPVDFEILEKLANDHLQPAILRFTEDKFMVVDAEKKIVSNPDHIWTYDKVEEIVMRARHQHLDIRFSSGKANRFRICSSYLQGITNELVLRAKPKNVKVAFEPGTRKFEYGLPQLLSETSSARTKVTAFSGKPSAPSATQRLMKNAPVEVQAAIQEQDRDLDEISNLISDITSIAETVGNELDRQNEHLDRITTRVDSANEKVKQTNKRIDRIL